MGDGEFGSVDLAVGFASELADGFEQEEETSHARVVGGEAAAVGVEGQPGLIEGQVAVFDELADLALGAESEVFEHHGDGDAERVVDHRDVDLVGRDAGLTVCGGSALGAGRGGDVAAVFAVLGGLAGADDPDRLFLDVARDLGRDKDGRSATIGDHAAFKQVQRVGDDARLEHVFDGDLVDLDELQVGHRLDGLGVAHRVLARRHRDLSELLGCGAVLVHVTMGDHGVVADQGAAVGRFHVLLPRGSAATHAAGANRDSH